MCDEWFVDLPADFVCRQVGHSYGSTTAAYMTLSNMALSDELDELNIGGDDA